MYEHDFARPDSRFGEPAKTTLQGPLCGNCAKAEKEQRQGPLQDRKAQAGSDDEVEPAQTDESISNSEEDAMETDDDSEGDDDETTPLQPAQPTLIVPGSMGLTLRISSTRPPLSLPPPQPVYYPIDNRPNGWTRHPITRESLREPPPHPPRNAFTQSLPMNHGLARGPSNLQLMGLAGLEQSPFLGSITSSPTLLQQYQSRFRYDEPSCATGVLYYEKPRLVKKNGKWVADMHGRGWPDHPDVGKDRESWLYMRRAEEVVWRRDLWAERGTGEWIKCLEGWIKTLPGGKERWEWKQVWGDVLNVNARMNLWVCERRKRCERQRVAVLEVKKCR